MTDAFCIFPKALMAAQHYISLTTGEEVQFTPSNKILWLVVKDRYDFFTGRGNEWFDNHDDIAALSGTTPSTVKRFLAELTKHGYLRTTKRRVNGCAFSNSYVVVQDLVLSSAGPVGKPKTMPVSPAIQQRPKPTLVHSPSYDETAEWDWDIR